MKNGEKGTAKQGIALIATRAHANVIPVCISGEYKFRSKIIIRIGKPIDFSQYYDQKLTSDKLGELSTEVLDKIYSLEEVND